MKKKIALLLAIVMTLALLPTNVFAYTQSSVRYKGSSSIGKTLLIESGSLLGGNPLYYGETSAETSEAWGALRNSKYVRAAAELLVEFPSGVESGDQFYVQLDGTDGWAPKLENNDKLTLTRKSDNVPLAVEMFNYDNGGFINKSAVATNFGVSSSSLLSGGMYARKGSESTVALNVNDLVYSNLGYTSPKGFFGSGAVSDINTSIDAIVGESSSGAIAEYNGNREQLPYVMSYESDNTATVTILKTNKDFTQNNSPVVVIPLPMVVGENNTATVQVVSRTGVLTTVSTSSKMVAVEGTAASVSISLDPGYTTYEVFPITNVKVQELRAGSVNSAGTFSITAPVGYEFVNPSDALTSSVYTYTSAGDWVWNSGVAVGSRTSANKTSNNGKYVAGWKWNATTPGNNVANQDERYYGNLTYGYWDLSSMYSWMSNYGWNLSNNYGSYEFDVNHAGKGAISGGFKAQPTVDRVYFKGTRNGDIDKTVAYISYSNLGKSTAEKGLVHFYDLPLLLRALSDSTATGDVLVDINNVSGDTGISQSKVKAGTRANWTVNLTAEATTSLYSGQYEGDAKSDSWHKVAKMKFEENVANSWLANRKTEFTFPEGVKISKVVIDNVNNVGTGDIKGTYEVGATGVYNKGYLTIQDNVITLSGLNHNITNVADSWNRANFTIEVWVSVEPGYEGNIDVSLGGTAILETHEPLTVATVKNPVNVVADAVTDIKIGYQYQTTANFKIEENKAGILRKGDTVKVSLTDGITMNDMSFADAKAEVIDGNLKIKNFKVAGYANSTATSANLSTNSSGTISFDIDTASSTASTIEFSNVQVKIDRTIPETTLTPYKLVVWGNAVANNYDSTTSPAPATFTTPGIMADYIRVATLATGNALNSKVEVTIGSSTIKVNGVESEIDTPAFIDPTNDSTMIPVRAISLALGIDWDNIHWDDSTKTVTIYSDNRVVQFTIGSDQIIVNGVSSTMTAADGSGRPVKAQLANDWSFIPFRALGNAFGVPVGWDPETQTAIFNPSK